jgi:hypothetical protein
MKLTKKTWTVLSRVFGFSGLGVWIGHFYFWYSYFNEGPSLPGRVSGHYIALNNHGSVHYITESQDHKITLMRVIAVLLLAACFVVYLRMIGPPKPWENKV